MLGAVHDLDGGGASTNLHTTQYSCVEPSTHVHVKLGNLNWLVNRIISVPDGTVSCCFVKCYYWEKLGKMYTGSPGSFLTTACESTMVLKFQPNMTLLEVYFNRVSVPGEDKGRNNLHKDGPFAPGPHTMLLVCSSDVMERASF